MKKTWNGEFRSLIISEDAHPELYVELARYTNRDRTNRFRTLALLGLFALQTRGGTASTIVEKPMAMSPENTSNQSVAVDRIKQKVLGSV